MKLGIMQPYFFPYIGYWQLLNYVDEYVVYEDVNYSKHGWINRNRILSYQKGGSQYFQIATKDAHQNKLINEISIYDEQISISKKIKTLDYIYKKAPCYNQAMPVIEQCLNFQDKNLSHYLIYGIQKIVEYLQINTQIIVSSDIKKETNLKGQEKILHICQLFNADVYVNAVGGKSLYSKEIFEKKAIELCFLETKEIFYKQREESFTENLSIIDIMMFNSQDRIREMLTTFTLS